jgi:hypothetical protein
VVKILRFKFRSRSHNMTQPPDAVRQLLRHGVAAASYRAAKPLRDAPASFADFRVADSCRTPAEILAHLGDVFDWALTLAQGKQAWHDSEPLPWAAEVERFYAAIKKFDDYLASAEPLHETPEKLLQGPVADAFNHIGQLAILRRISGAPIKGENYHVAEVTAGRTGPEQSAPRFEFN